MNARSIRNGCPSEADARHIARQLSRSAETWSRTFGQTAGPDHVPLCAELQREIQAYALCLLDFSLGGFDDDARRNFVSAVRRECGLHLPPGGWLGTGNSGFEGRYAAITRSGGGRSPQSEKVFQEFCQATGLGVDTLVGRGANLASLVFYIVLHARISATVPLRREAIQRLLKTAKECRAYYQVSLAEWLATTHAPPQLQSPHPSPATLAPASTIRALPPSAA